MDFQRKFSILEVIAFVDKGSLEDLFEDMEEEGFELGGNPQVLIRAIFKDKGSEKLLSFINSVLEHEGDSEHSDFKMPGNSHYAAAISTQAMTSSTEERNHGPLVGIGLDVDYYNSDSGSNESGEIWFYAERNDPKLIVSKGEFYEQE